MKKGVILHLVRTLSPCIETREIEITLNPRRAGGGRFYASPSGFSQIYQKRRRAAPLFLAHLILRFYRIGCQTFSSRSSKVRLPGQVNPRLTGGGGYFEPPPISETTGLIFKIQTGFDSHYKSVQRNLITLTLRSPMTSQVRSKSNCSRVLDIHAWGRVGS